MLKKTENLVSHFYPPLLTKAAEISAWQRWQQVFPELLVVPDHASAALGPPLEVLRLLAQPGQLLLPVKLNHLQHLKLKGLCHQLNIFFEAL
jgi:hypothetical protein